MRNYLLLFSLIFSSVCEAQSLAQIEAQIALLHNKLTGSRFDVEKDSICNSMREEIIKSFQFDEAFDYPFDKLNFCKIKSSDNHVRLLNWNLPYADGTHKYFCFVLVRDVKSGGFRWKELKDNPNEVDKVENKILTEDKWLGMLYYDIIPMGKKKSDQYTLLGWDGKDNLTNRKVVDVMDVGGSKIKFGANIFNTESTVAKRIILEYSDEVSASIKFYADKKTIVMDHLSPKNPMMVGIFADYGPDGSYDMFVMNKDKWDYLDNVDISKFAADDGKPFYDPRQRRKKK